jgi:hypothetical protein
MTSLILCTGIISIYATLTYKKITNILISNPGLPSVIRIMKSRRVRWASHVAHMGRRNMPREFWWECQRK